jgi:WD40 repeat protein
MLSVDGVSVVMPGHGVDCRLCAVLVFACVGLYPLLFFSSLLISSLFSVMSSDLVCFSQAVRCVVALSDGRRVVSGSFESTLRVWDVDTGECVRELKGHDGVSEC